MATRLDPYRKPARLRRRAPRPTVDGAIHLSVKPNVAASHPMATSQPLADTADHSTVSVFRLRRHAPALTGYSRSELACAAAMIQNLAEGNDVRTDKIDAVRASLAADGYAEAMKLEIAVDRLLQDLAADAAPLR